MRRVRLAAVAAALFVLATSGGVHAGLTEQKVRATPVGEYGPIADDGFLGWYQNTSAKPFTWKAYLRPDGQPKVKLNADGTQGATGGIDDSTVAFQQFKPKKGISNIRLYDITTGTSGPAPVNTKDWEFWPSISGEWLLFGRQNVSDLTYSVVLFSFVNFQEYVLATASKKNWVGPGQVNGNYVVYEKCVGFECDVWLYNIATDTKTKIPRPSDQQYAPSVDEFGTMYFIRSTDVCGKIVSLVGRPLGGPSTVLVSLPAEREVQRTFVHTDGVGDNHVFYDRFRLTTKCVWKPLSSNLYKVVDDGTLAKPAVVSDGSAGRAKDRAGLHGGMAGAPAGSS